MVDKVIRSNVDRRLRREGRPPTTDPEWQFVQEQRWIEAMSVDEILLTLIVARRTWGSDTEIEPVQRGRGAPDARNYALALFIAEMARAIPAVQTFRQEHCADGLIKISEIEAWVRKVANAEGPVPIVEPEPDEQLPVWARPGFHPSDALRPLTKEKSDVKLLAYPRPDLKVALKPVRSHGTLGDLVQLARRLTDDFHWSDAEAVMFVLSDQPPPFSPVKIEPSVSSISPCLSRITLVIDAALAPSQVKDTYTRARNALLQRRYRNLTRKHALLAGFSATFRTETLRDQMRKWNAQYPNWKYKLVTNFGRDVKQARERLLEPANLKSPISLGVKDGQTKTRK